MDFEQLLRGKSAPAGVLLRGMPAGDSRVDHLIRQLMALANAQLAGPRCLLFGVEPGAAGVISVIGLGKDDLRVLEAQRKICVEAIEPALDLALVTGQVAGKPVAALCVGGSLDPPYVAGELAPPPLRSGECWTFDHDGLRPASRGDFDHMYEEQRLRRGEAVMVGLGDDPRCELLDVTVPDASVPPSRRAARKLQAAIAAKKTASVMMGRDDTELGRLTHARIYGADKPFQQQGLETLVRALQSAPEDYREADLHYRFEQQAVRLNFSVLNGSAYALSGAAIEITLPAVPGLSVASRLYPAAGEGPAADLGIPPYPDVRRAGDCFRVRSSLGELAVGITAPVFATPLRLAVDRNLVGQKVAIRYTLVAQGLEPPRRGRLRLRFQT